MPGEMVPAALPSPGHTAYSSLVEGDDDLVGLIAYSLYKSDKLSFLPLIGGLAFGGFSR